MSSSEKDGLRSRTPKGLRPSDVVLLQIRESTQKSITSQQAAGVITVDAGSEGPAIEIEEEEALVEDATAVGLEALLNNE